MNTREKRIQKFIVLIHNGFYGFDPSTCIFDTLDELIIAYSRIPFKVHDPKYGNLSLNYPALASQNKQS